MTGAMKLVWQSLKVADHQPCDEGVMYPAATTCTRKLCTGRCWRQRVVAWADCMLDLACIQCCLASLS